MWPVAQESPGLATSMQANVGPWRGRVNRPGCGGDSSTWNHSAGAVAEQTAEESAMPSEPEAGTLGKEAALGGIEFAYLQFTEEEN